MLNELADPSSSSDRYGKPKNLTGPLRYQHSYLIDSFYSSESPGGDKVRVTRDEKTGEVRECVKKIRLGNLDVFSPKYCADWRVSVNMEVPSAYHSIFWKRFESESNCASVNHPKGTASFSRKKDRLSYSHEEFVIDLTQVRQQDAPGQQVSRYFIICG
jgi:polynucleotide 5'-triphosphatase